MITTRLLLALAAMSLATRALAQSPPPPPVPSPTNAMAPVCYGFVGLHGGMFEHLAQYADVLQVKLVYLGDDDLAAKRVSPAGFDVIYLQHLLDSERDDYRAFLMDALQQNPRLRIISLQGLGTELFQGVSNAPPVEVDSRLASYYSTSKENMRRLLVYALATYSGRDLKIEPPAEEQTFGLYHPDHEGPFDTAAAFVAWSRSRGLDVDHMPRVALAVHSLHLVFQQPKVVTALIRRLEQEGILAVTIIDTPPPQKQPPRDGETSQEPSERLFLEFQPNAVIHICHGLESVEFRKRLGVPHLHSLFFRKKSIDQWYASEDGIDPSEFMFQVAAQEILGAIEPQTGAGTTLGGGSMETFTPIADRIDHLVRRTAGWVKLARKRNAEKRVAIVYYDRELGKSELMRGSATGMFLNGPRSLLALLQRMKGVGYRIDPMPRDEDELVAWMMARGRQVGVWAPGELARLVREGAPALVPVEPYREWLQASAPAESIEALEAKWGAAPGRFMVWQDAQQQPKIVIPRIELGNIVLLPQPLRGEANDQSLVHDRRLPPPHNYVATYLWLEHEFHADAMIHFGTHGTELMLPGKNVGLARKDWSDIVMGGIPNINPWIINNLGETMPAKRRAYAVLTSHLTPPTVRADLSDALLNLHGDLDKWDMLEPGALKETFRAAITRQVLEQHLDADLHFTGAADRLLTTNELAQVAVYLHQIENEVTPVSLHVLGEPPSPEALMPYLVVCLRKNFLETLGTVITVPAGDERLPGDRDVYLRGQAEEAVRLVVNEHLAPADAVRAIGGAVPAAGLPEGLAKSFALARELDAGFKQTGQEIDNILLALDGKFVPPGPGNEPARNPGAVPTGRNLFVLNPEEVPSQSSWELGRTLTDQMLQAHVQQHGHYPRKIAMDLSSFATFADFGVMESQIFYLIGVEPVWDEKNVVADVKVIPREALGRPRIDVFISSLSYYRDNLPSRMVLIDKAIRLVAGLDEAENGIRQESLDIERRLVSRQVPAARAAMLSRARIFGYPPGQYGDLNYYYLSERSGKWDTREQLMEMYLDQVQNVYTEGAWGESTPEAYQEAIQGTEVVLRTWADPVASPLANKYTWFMGGSLSMAVKYLTGKEPEYILSDVRDPGAARMVSAEDVVRQEFRTRVSNRKWIEGMMKEGYAGPDQVAVMFSNTLGWEIMRPDTITDDMWAELKAIYLDDKLKMSLPQWLEAQNPYAMQDMLEVLLESARKGYWQADAATVAALSRRYVESVVRHGEGGGLRGGGNTNLESFVKQSLEQAGPAPAELMAAYAQKLQEQLASASESAAAPNAAPAASVPAPQKVKGTKLEPAAIPPPESAPPRTLPWQKLELLALVALLFAWGAARRSGGPTR